MGTIILQGPFYNSQEDEELFFRCIYGLPGYKEVIGKGTELHINFQGEVSSEAMSQLNALCIRWTTKICR